MSLPITYVPGFIAEPNHAIKQLQEGLEWERREQVPRSEYYCNDFSNPYVYGRGRGIREYHPRPYTDAIKSIRSQVEEYAHCKFEVCFLNRYHDQSDHLGWHADDSPEMDDNRPIAIVSLGVEREIWFRRQGEFKKGDVIRISGADGVYVRADPAVENSHYITLNGKTQELRCSTAALEFPKHIVTLGHGSLCLMAAGMQDTWQHRIPKASFKSGERISLTFRGYVEAK